MLKRILLAAFVALVPSLAFGQVVNWGDYQDSNQTIYLYFNSVGTDGVAETLTSGAVEIYEDGGTTQITSAETLTASFDSIVGFNQLAVDLNDAGFETGKTYTAILTAGTVDSVSVTGRVVGVFSVGRYASANDIFAVPGADPTSVPGPTATIGEKINWLFAINTNRKRVTQALIEWFAADGTTVIGEAAINPNNSTEVDQAETAAP